MPITKTITDTTGTTRSIFSGDVPAGTTLVSAVQNQSRLEGVIRDSWMGHLKNTGLNTLKYEARCYPLAGGELFEVLVSGTVSAGAMTMIMVDRRCESVDLWMAENVSGQTTTFRSEFLGYTIR